MQNHINENSFYYWQRVIRKETLAKYPLPQSDVQTTFVEYPSPMDNNETEASLRSFCLHKHAWKVIDTMEGAKASAIIYSITETAKANGLNPFRYMEYLLTELMEHLDDTNHSFLDDLLPWSKTLPDICRSGQQK